MLTHCLSQSLGCINIKFDRSFWILIHLVRKSKIGRLVLLINKINFNYDTIQYLQLKSNWICNELLKWKIFFWMHSAFNFSGSWCGIICEACSISMSNQIKPPWQDNILYSALTIKPAQTALTREHLVQCSFRWSQY